MRRLSVFLLMAGLALGNVGCIFIVDVKGSPKPKHVIEIDGEFYVVDIKAHSVRKIDLDEKTESEDARETEAEDDD